jgi:hypothetical protein
MGGIHAPTILITNVAPVALQSVFILAGGAGHLSHYPVYSITDKKIQAQ